ncbi:MAG: ATP-dependent Clp protease ATP-binding subunit ClpX [Spirochaetota bacterium]
MAKKEDKDKEVRCSFCGRGEGETSHIIEGHNVAICSDCVATAHDLITKKPQTGKKEELNVIPPHEIKAVLDEYVIGQDFAKKILSVAVYNHYKRIRMADKKSTHTFGDVEIEKSNILLVGPTGSGKTLLARTLAKTLNVPFAIADATTLTEAGYVGEDVENILLRLIQNAGGNIPLAEKGIIYIDEIDKISRKSESQSITRDVSGEGVQQALLKIVEGTIANVPPQGGRKHPHQEYLRIDTTNILFICGGAFVDLEKTVAERINKKGMGFTTDVAAMDTLNYGEIIAHVTPQDLIKYGIIPELVGRLPVIAHLDDLDAVALKRILTEPKNALVKQYQKLFAYDSISLAFDDGALDLVVSEAIKRKVGARGLRAILETIMLDLMYDIPAKKNVKTFTVSRDLIASELKTADAPPTAQTA